MASKGDQNVVIFLIKGIILISKEQLEIYIDYSRENVDESISSSMYLSKFCMYIYKIVGNGLIVQNISSSS